MKSNLIVIMGIFLPNFLLAQFNFIEKPSTGLPNWNAYFIVPIDFDSDSDLDVIISGSSIHGEEKTHIYENDGFCNFLLNTSFSTVSPLVSSAKVTDFNQDGKPDILMLEIDSLNERKPFVYINSAANTFTPYPIDISSYPLIYGAFISDLNNDSYPDIVLTGLTTLFLINDQNMGFSINDSSIFRNKNILKSIFADVDQDGDEDLITTAYLASNLYVNDGTGSFSPKPIAMPSISSPRSPVAADFNNDSLPDILYLDNYANRYYAKLLTNQGNNIFTETYVGIGLTHPAQIIVDDANMDGNQDVFFNKKNTPTPPKLIAFAGTGTDELSYSKLELFDLLGGALANFDCDNDGDHDFMMIGWRASAYHNKIYLNDAIVGMEEFPEETLQVFPNPSSGIFTLSNQQNHLIKIDVLHISGKLVTQFSLNPKQEKIWQSNLPSGIYLLRTKNHHGIQTQKIVVL